MFSDHDQAIYDLLRDAGVVEVAELDRVRTNLVGSGKSLADGLIGENAMAAETLFACVAKSLGCICVSDTPEALGAETVALLPADLARSYGVVPLRADETGIQVLAVDPFNPRIVDDLTFVLGREVRVVVSDPRRVAMLIKRYYGEDETTLDQIVGEMVHGAEPSRVDEELSTDDLEALAGRAPVIRLVNLILVQGIRQQASDIHFEPFQHEFKVRCRVDGVLSEMAPPPKSLALSVTSRLKVLANLNIAERRVPQDGRMKLMISGRAVDLRVSTLPTQFGESVVLRILDQSSVQLSITDLGMPEDVVSGVREMVCRPNGIFVVTGPTGSGKTTTLYSALRLINTPDLKLLTAEDPVEYEVEGIMQVPVNPGIGLNFAATLRSFLRQDPDVIMIGEIRDVETAQIAVQASLTGHLVLSTLHTNDAAGAVTRLIDMGVEPFLIASTLEAVLAQRLVRRICRQCRRVYEPSPALHGTSDGDWGVIAVHSEGAGCAVCNGTGYRGRTGIYEWLRMSEELRDLVIARAPTRLIRQKAVERGMQTLRENGLAAVAGGVTTLSEVQKYT